MSDERLHKPPLGAMPAWISATRRIIELAKAINRNAADYSDGNELLIKKWAEEIRVQCEILSRFPPGSEPDIPIPEILFRTFNNQKTKEGDDNS